MLGVLFSAGSILSGCETVQSRSELGRDLQPSAGEPHGWVVASVGVRRFDGDAMPYHTNAVHFREVGASGTRATGAFMIHITDYNHQGLADLDVSHDGLYASVQRVAVRPGEYALVGGLMKTDVGTMVVQQRVDDEDIRFTVHEGRTTYLGSFNALTLAGQNRRGAAVRAGALFEVDDQLTRDMAILASRESDGADYGDVVPADLDVPAVPGRFFVRAGVAPQ